MLTQKQAHTRVALGAAHLDTVKPNWFDLVNTDTLQLSSWRQCVIGQLSSGATPFVYSYGLRELGILISDNINNASAYGFVLMNEQRDAIDIDEYEQAYRFLQDAWIETIAERRCAAKIEQPELVEVS